MGEGRGVEPERIDIRKSPLVKISGLDYCFAKMENSSVNVLDFILWFKQRSLMPSKIFQSQPQYAIYWRTAINGNLSFFGGYTTCTIVYEGGNGSIPTMSISCYGNKPGVWTIVCSVDKVNVE
jgi:hypothetical protein